MGELRLLFPVRRGWLLGPAGSRLIHRAENGTLVLDTELAPYMSVVFEFDELAHGHRHWELTQRGFEPYPYGVPYPFDIDTAVRELNANEARSVAVWLHQYWRELPKQRTELSEEQKKKMLAKRNKSTLAK